MKNAMTVDVEDWYQTQDFGFDCGTWASFEDRIEANTGRILELLSRYNVRATFFIPGYVAKQHRGLVRSIAAAGHEIGSHGGYHRMVGTLTANEFREDVRCSRSLLEDIAGSKVNMFRAPSWSISPVNLWALEVLEEEGFICDSSMQPFRTPLSGYSGTPVMPFRPVISGRRLNMVEFPPSVLDIGRFRLPFSGGFYLRASPYAYISRALKKVNSRREGMVFIHPWETDVSQPRLKAPIHIAVVHYFNLRTTYGKLERLLENFSFVTLGELLDEHGEFPEIAL